MRTASEERGTDSACPLWRSEACWAGCEVSAELCCPLPPPEHCWPAHLCCGKSQAKVLMSNHFQASRQKWSCVSMEEMWICWKIQPFGLDKVSCLLSAWRVWRPLVFYFPLMCDKQLKPEVELPLWSLMSLQGWCLWNSSHKGKLGFWCLPTEAATTACRLVTSSPTPASLNLPDCREPRQNSTGDRVGGPLADSAVSIITAWKSFSSVHGGCTLGARWTVGWHVVSVCQCYLDNYFQSNSGEIQG